MDDRMDFSEFLTQAEASKLLRTSELTLYRLRRSGELPFYRVSTKVLYRRSDIETYLRRGQKSESVAAG